ncbi:hypothetical protein SMICM304S_07640 [Streptomyces microflavus]
MFSIRIAFFMWFFSYAEVSSSTSTMATCGSSMWASTQSASTRTSLRLDVVLLRGSLRRVVPDAEWSGGGAADTRTDGARRVRGTGGRP